MLTFWYYTNVLVEGISFENRMIRWKHTKTNHMFNFTNKLLKVIIIKHADKNVKLPLNRRHIHKEPHTEII